MSRSAPQPNHAAPVIQEFLEWVPKHCINGTSGPSTTPNHPFMPLRDLEAYLKAESRTTKILRALFERDYYSVDVKSLESWYIRVFTILTLIGKGRYIERVVHIPNLRDDHLPFLEKPSHFPIEPNDPTFWDKFYEKQFAFCPHYFRLNENPMLEDPYILPIISKEALAQGGSAAIYKIKLHPFYDLLNPAADFFEANRARPANTYVLKTYNTKDAHDYYQNEVDAFKKLAENRTDQSLIQFLGSYRQGDIYNILLEYADCGTLEDYFQCVSPPSLGEDIVIFWRALFNVLKALSNIHAIERYDGLRWHQDVKPSNILVLSRNSSNPYDVEFKLAARGLSHFQRTVESDLWIADGYIRGTKYYVAPECHRKFNDKPLADIWSFGAVCSEAAVWVVRGKLGLMDYRNRRKQENHERGTSQGGSRFHDGKKLLQTVETTHNRLLTKGEVRPGDRVTLPILDQLVDSMLEVKPEARLDAIQLWKRSDRLFQTVQLELQELTFPPRRSSTFTRIAESDLSETESTASSMWSDSSKSSASSSASTNDTFEAALDEVIDVFVSDKDLRSLFAEAFIGQNRVKFSRNAVRLLKWLGRRLMVAANTPAEKEAAKFFLSRRHDQAIIDRIAIGMITQSSKQEKQGQIKDLPQHESTKQERLESYLQQMEMSTTSREPEETGKVLSDGESDSSSDSDEEKDRKQTAQWKVFDVVKLFLKSGDAFARFKEELEDLISPFRSESMWTKELWNGRERVRFEHSNNVPRLTMIDKLKLAVEEMLGLPILWWPLKQPRKHLPSSKVRIIWICECGDETYIDVSCAKARRYRQMCDTKPVKFTAAQPSTLPTHNTSLPSSSDSGGLRASTSALIGKATRNLQQRFRRNKSARSASQGSEQNATIVVNPTPNPKFVNWCVDSAPSRTFRHSICLEEKKEKYFIDELYKSYRKLRGWRWYLSMTTCAEIKLVKYDSVYSAEEKDVSCDFKGDVLPNLGDQMEYTYKIDPPDLEKEIHIRRAERALIDYYHGYKRCNDANRLEQLILGIPHRVTGKKHGPKGYGIWARQGWTIPRLAAFFLVTQGWAIVFMAVWLCYHPGDVQNAFSPGYYSLGVVTVFIAIPDVFLT